MKVLRLIEHEPAWELHILLRIIGLAYTTDYSPTPFALGRPLPILVDDSTIYSGEGCFRYLSKQCPYYPNIEAADELITSYLQKHLIQVYENFLVLNKDNYKNLLRNDAFGVRIQQSFLLDLQSIIPSFQKKHLLFPDYNADQLRLKLLQTFSSLNDKLVDWDENSILSSWSDDYQFVSDQYGIADALLYGQIVRFLTNEEFSTLISSHEQIMKYFEHLNNRYFVSIDIHDSIEPYWNVSLQVLLNNPYNRYNPDAEDIIEALQLPELDVVDHLQLRDIWTEDLPTIYTSPFRVTDSSTLSSTSERLTAPLVTPKKGIAEEEEEIPSPNSQSPVSKYLSSKKWIFTATFNLAVGASFIGYFIQTMNHR